MLQGDALLVCVGRLADWLDFGLVGSALMPITVTVDLGCAC
jgi:hypothetical protein